MFVVNGTDLARSCNGQISEVRSPIFFPFLFFFFFFFFVSSSCMLTFQTLINLYLDILFGWAESSVNVDITFACGLVLTPAHAPQRMQVYAS